MSCVACVGLAEIQGLSEGPLAIAVQIQAREAAAEENLLGARVFGGFGTSGPWVLLERLLGLGRGPGNRSEPSLLRSQERAVL